ncbi:hypothetical protein Tco_1314925, partial [Tanacetum coccineum]
MFHLKRLTPTDDLTENLTKTVALLAQSYIAHLSQSNNQLRTSSNIRNQATVQNSRVVVQNVQGRQNRCQGNYARGAVAAGNRGILNRVSNANAGQAKQIKCYNYNGENGVILDEEQLLFIASGQTNTFNNDVDEAPVQDLTLNEDNVFQADQCDAFDFDVDEALTVHTMFMANLSSVNPIYDELGPSYDLDILSKVQDHDNYVDSVGEYHEVHEMQNDVQPNYVVDSDAEYMSGSNIVPYEQYVKDNVVQVIQSNVSFVPNDALMMIINDMHEQSAQCVFANEQNKEELLKKELHSVKMQLNSTINHNKLIKEEVTKLKKDFKQKENKYLEEFLDMKQLKEK